MEPINWPALTPEQRDQLMVEKVLGYSLELVQDSIDKIPRYSTSLDAAWLLWPKLQEASDEVLCKFKCAWDDDDEMSMDDWQWYDPSIPFLTVGQMADVTPERICVAMLRAFDYEVLTEEVSQ
jgi:hypothetical protein